MVQLANGIQLAGPHLTPQSFEKGLFSLGHRPADPVWSIGGGYGPGDFSYADTVAELWWDPAASNPATPGTVGSYKYVRGGQRYARGQIPREDPMVFKDGVMQPGGP